MNHYNRYLNQKENAGEERGDLMRKTLMLIVCVGLVAMLMSSCVYMKVQRPHDKNYDKTEL